MLFITTTIILSLTNIFFFFKFRRAANELFKERFNNSHFQEKIANLEGEIASQSKKIDSYLIYNNDLQNLKGKFEGSFNQAREELLEVRREKASLLEKIDQQSVKITDFEKKTERLAQNFEQLNREKQEWEKNKDVKLLELSQELMRKNHEQQEKMTQTAQEQVAKITQGLLKDFETIFTKVENMDGEIKKSTEIRDALLTPGGAGRSSEVTLENILKSSGLKEKPNLLGAGDYVLQSHFSDAGGADAKRPDAILFLPNNHVVIIDSKSSPHFLELAIARKNDDKVEEKAVMAKIKESMRRHVEALKKRDYEKFFQQEMQLNDISDYKILNAMFLQTEQMLDIVDEIDHFFVNKAMSDGILILSPIGLINLLNQAKFIVERIKQQENIVDLKKEVERLINNVALLFKESRDVGKALNKGLSSYNKMTKRFNSGILKNVKNIGELGIVAKKSDDIRMLEDFEMEENQGDLETDGE